MGKMIFHMREMVFPVEEMVLATAEKVSSPDGNGFQTTYYSKRTSFMVVSLGGPVKGTILLPTRKLKSPVLLVSHRVLPSTRIWYVANPPPVNPGFRATVGRIVRVFPEISYAPALARSESKAATFSSLVGAAAA